MFYLRNLSDIIDQMIFNSLVLCPGLIRHVINVRHIEAYLIQGQGTF